MSALRIMRRRQERLGLIRRIYLWGRRQKPKKPFGFKARAKQFARWSAKAFFPKWHLEPPKGKLNKRLRFVYWVKAR